MKKILSLIMLLSFAFSAFAQDSNDTAPHKGDFMASINFGVGSYIGASAPSPGLSSYSLSAPMQAWFDNKPILDLEGRYMVSDKWSLKLTGGFNYSYSPSYNEITGTGSTEEGGIPTYNAIPSGNNIQFFVGAGADCYVKSFFNKLHLRIGGEVGFAYGRITKNAKDDEAYIGATLGEAYSVKIAPVMGVDYFINYAIFFGLDIRPISYRYAIYGERPQVGMKMLESDNHSFSFISQPMVKLGVKF